MNFSTFSLAALPNLAKTDTAYCKQVAELRPFYKYQTEVASFAQIIADKGKQYSQTQRDILVQSFENQYKNLPFSEKAQHQISQLKQENTFTVITAHQPNVLLGPLYFIYKIASTIHLANQLTKEYADYQFVPVFVMNAEDHDFAELNHTTVFGKKLVWETEAQGAVGNLNTDSLQPLLAELATILGESENAKTIYTIINECYTKYNTYEQATQALIHRLFEKYGLLVLNMNDKLLKRTFLPFLEKELFDSDIQRFVSQTQEKLQALGYKAQAYPREINVFYLKDNLRARIEFDVDNQIFKVLGTTISFSKEELKQELHEFPEHFSPNVIFRTLYQEVIFPNLAYVGGGGELAYWLETKAMFEHYGINFPMLIRRNSGLYLPKMIQEKLQKLGLTWQDLLAETDTLLKNYIAQKAEVQLDFSIQKENLAAIFDSVLSVANQVDNGLEKTILAEKTKQLQALEALTGKIFKAEKQKNETTLTQIRNLQQKVFPNGGLAERIDNFLPLYLSYGEELFSILIEKLSPLENSLLIWEE